MSNIIKIKDAKKKSKGHHKWLLGLVLFITLICFLLLSPIFNIKKIEVNGNTTISEEYIVSSVTDLYDKNILAINKFDVIDRINELPIIASTKLRRKWPDTIHIDIEEKKPIAETKFYGSKLLLSENGEVINVITDNTETGLPFLEGICVQDVKSGETLKCKEDEKVKKYLEVLKKLKENDMLNEVDKLSEKEGFLIYFKSGHIVFLGDIDNLQHKIDWLKSIVNKEQNASYIDLHNLDKVVTKPVWEFINPPKIENIPLENMGTENKEINEEEKEEKLKEEENKDVKKENPKV